MTREDAIDVLKAYLMFDKSSQQVAKALDMAIEALSAEYVRVEADTLPPKVPLEWITQGMILLPRKDYEELRKGLEKWQSIADMPPTDTDLISRADAIEAMEARIKWFNGDAIEDRCKRDAFIQALDKITELPSADAVQVVRCKDCEYMTTEYDDEGTAYWWCDHWDNGTDDWGHCYCGERREP